MKVLHLTSHVNPGGITTYILRLVQPLRKRGVEIHLGSAAGTSLPLFQEMNVNTYSFPFRTKSELDPRLYRAIPSLIRWIRENQIDLIHAHTRVMQVLANWIRVWTKIPVITTCHGFYTRRLGRRLNPAWGDYVVAISEGVETHLLEDFKMPRKKVRMIYNGVNIEELDRNFSRHEPGQTKESFGFRPDDFVITNIARLVADKGQEFLLRAVADLKDQFPAIKLLIVGEGRERYRLETLAKKLGIPERVVFTGALSDVTRPLVATDLFVFPATWREGFGLSIIEAMACRKAIVATNIWNLSTLIKDGETGILVEPKRADSLAQVISLLIKDLALRKKLEENGRKMVEGMFSIDRMADKIAEVYRQALQNHEKSLTGKDSSL